MNILSPPSYFLIDDGRSSQWCSMGQKLALSEFHRFCASRFLSVFFGPCVVNGSDYGGGWIPRQKC